MPGAITRVNEFKDTGELDSCTLYVQRFQRLKLE